MLERNGCIGIKSAVAQATALNRLFGASDFCLLRGGDAEISEGKGFVVCDNSIALKQNLYSYKMNYSITYRNVSLGFQSL